MSLYTYEVTFAVRRMEALHHGSLLKESLLKSESGNSAYVCMTSQV